MAQNSDRTEKGQAHLATKGWQWLTRWLAHHINAEVRDLELELRNDLLAGKYRQNKLTVRQFSNKLLALTREFDSFTEKEMIVWCLSGMNPELVHMCRCDPRGKPWDTLEHLVEHAMAREMEISSRGQKLNETERPHSRTDSWKKKRTWGNTNKPSFAPALAAIDTPTPLQPWRQQPNKKHCGGEGGSGGGTGGGSGANRFRTPTPDKGRGQSTYVPPKTQTDWAVKFPGEQMARCKEREYTHLLVREAKWLGRKGRCYTCMKPMSQCRERPDRAQNCEHYSRPLSFAQVVGNNVFNTSP